jgi:bifunctional DNA-binding transcriptional regulator/antitoxin component of YhaV-PrlF toxin-antitoxin module
VASTYLRAKGRFTIPTAVCKAAHLEKGHALGIEVTQDGILLRPRKQAEPDPAWLQTPAGQARVREAIDTIVTGRERIFESDEELLTVLEQMPPADADV